MPRIVLSAAKAALRCFCALWLLIASGVAAAESPAVVLHTLKVLEMISAELLTSDDQQTVQTQLLPMAASHNHSYTTKFSDLRRLQSADLFVWLGPEFERHLDRPLAALHGGPRTFAWLPEHDEHDSLHENELHNTHVWLDPLYMADRVPQLATALGTVQPVLAKQIQASALTYAASLRQLQIDLAARLAPYRGMGVVSDHGGLEPFLMRFGLRHMGSLSANHHGSLSLKRVQALRGDVASGATRCLVVTNKKATLQQDSRRLFADLGVPVVELDPMGLEASSYSALLESIANALAECLAD